MCKKTLTLACMYECGVYLCKCIIALTTHTHTRTYIHKYTCVVLLFIDVIYNGKYVFWVKMKSLLGKVTNIVYSVYLGHFDQFPATKLPCSGN